MIRRAIAACLVALPCFAYGRAALAETSEAERLFFEGRALMLEGRFDEACPKIAESQRLEPHVGTLLNLAACHERQGKLGSAWVEYQKALTAARAEGQRDRARLAEERLAAIEPHVPWLRLSPRTAAADVVVKLDGSEIASVALGTELPVDPGPHVVDVAVSGEPVFEARFELLEGEHRTIVLETSGGGAARPRDDAPPPASTLVVEPPPAPAPPPPPPAKPAEKSRWVLEPGLYIAFATGNVDRARAKDEDAIVLEADRPPHERTSCAAHPCGYGEAAVPGTASAGLNLFAGYAFTESLRAGVRVIAGPMFSGGSVWAFGPSLGLRATSALTFGVFGVAGDATLSGYAQVAAPTGYRHVTDGTSPAVRGGLAGGFGAGVELSLRLVALARGELLATSTPLFIEGEHGTLFALPVGLRVQIQHFIGIRALFASRRRSDPACIRRNCIGRLFARLLGTHDASQNRAFAQNAGYTPSASPTASSDETRDGQHPRRAIACAYWCFASSPQDGSLWSLWHR